MWRRTEEAKDEIKLVYFHLVIKKVNRGFWFSAVLLYILHSIDKNEAIRLSRVVVRLRQHVRHRSTCELNQTKRHAPYDELVPIITPTLPFRTIVMDFILALSRESNTVLIETTRRKTLFLGAEEWEDKVLERATHSGLGSFWGNHFRSR